MVYKNGEIVRQEQHLMAKATLDDLANRMNRGKYMDLVWAEDALQTMGFCEKGSVSHKFTGPIMMYSRKTAAGIELLVDRDLEEPFDKTPHLYQIPKGQDVAEWFDSLPPTENRKRTSSPATKISATKIVVVGGMSGITYLLIDYIVEIPNQPGPAMLAAVVAGLVGNVAAAACERTYRFLTRKNPLDNQTISKGEDALRYIARTPYLPLQRFEELKQLDADHKAEVEALGAEQKERVRKR